MASSNVCVPLVLQNAQAEVLHALAARDEASAAAHRRRADDYVRLAIRSLCDDPDRTHDWSGLRSPA